MNQELSTAMQLLAVYRAPAIDLEIVASEYLNIGSEVARRRAALNELPFPTFRVGSNRNAPVMVKIKDLAAHIDATCEAAEVEWRKSQV